MLYSVHSCRIGFFLAVYIVSVDHLKELHFPVYTSLMAHIYIPYARMHTRARTHTHTLIVYEIWLFWLVCEYRGFVQILFPGIIQWVGNNQNSKHFLYRLPDLDFPLGCDLWLTIHNETRH